MNKYIKTIGSIILGLLALAGVISIASSVTHNHANDRVTILSSEYFPQDVATFQVTSIKTAYYQTTSKNKVEGKTYTEHLPYERYAITFNNAKTIYTGGSLFENLNDVKLDPLDIPADSYSDLSTYMFHPKSLLGNKYTVLVKGAYYGVTYRDDKTGKIISAEFQTPPTKKHLTYSELPVTIIDNNPDIDGKLATQLTKDAN